MQTLYNEMNARLASLESQEQTKEVLIRINELSLHIVIVQQIMLNLPKQDKMEDRLGYLESLEQTEEVRTRISETNIILDMLDKILINMYHQRKLEIENFNHENEN